MGQDAAAGWVDLPEPGEVPSGLDAEGFRFGWEARMRGRLTLRSWHEVEPSLRNDWAALHATHECAGAHDWDSVASSVRAGWEAARRRLEESL